MGLLLRQVGTGKAKTVFQIIAILLFIIKGSPLLLGLHSSMEGIMYVISWVFMIIALILTVVSMCDYFVKCAPIFKFNPEDSFSNFSHEGIKNAQPLPWQASEIVLKDCIQEEASQVIKLAIDKNKTLSTAESCTGGLIGGTLTAISGSSSAVEGGVISYSNNVKQIVLGVSARDIEQVGAVSSEVAAQMADGSRKTCQSDIAVSVTGIAGPGGAVPGKPVGTVWFGLSTDSYTKTFVRHLEEIEEK